MEAKAKKNNTLKKIIKSAKILFLENGFNGTSIRDIAKKANVQSSLIYHYFSNKVDLWKVVKESLINPENFSSINECIKQDKFEDFVKKLVEARFNIHASNPDMLKILDWQRLEKNSSLTGIKNQENFASFDQLEERIKHFQEAGQLSKDFSAKYVLLFISAATLAPFTRSYELDKDILEESDFVKTTTTLLLKAFKK
ncbi:MULTISPECIES: TetR/AcrR family transcriptional regulator [unclassified Francisella]|uniref:TetR/AcrR family transcriptional regulator n=1 Tax=unclassified Francisella TaxID=2610885 RepID=UPI002E30B889|nr:MULTISPECIES: TetR family transcriptional regulator [unclassified Francisella]MED7819363.1 TetR family transcriptional regulator [Francisella sp. 19S2-4]MED7830180.1 TetR family transcriptional regulator [Francisella sp. 19S2-10]